MDLGRIGAFTIRAALQLEPILHDHRDARRPATILLLLYKGNVQPYAFYSGGRQNSTKTGGQDHQAGEAKAGEAIKHTQRTATIIRTSATIPRTTKSRSRSLSLPAAKS